MSFPTVYQQTGYKRSHPAQILQDNTLLMKIETYNYDLTKPGFMEYCHTRGVPCFDTVSMMLDPDPLAKKIATIHAGKLQDCWELWLRQIGVLPYESYKDIDHELQQLLNTIYRRD